MSATLNWLRTQCDDHLLTEKWLLCHDLRTGQTWKDRVNLAGTATVNLHAKTVRSIVTALVSQSLAATNTTWLNHAAAGILVHELVTSAMHEGRLQYFADVQHVDGLAGLITRSIRDLRLADVNPTELTENAFQTRAKAADLRGLLEAYATALNQRNLADYADCLDLALCAIDEETLALPAGLKIFVPYDLQLSKKESRFLESLSGRGNIVCRPPAERASTSVNSPAMPLANRTHGRSRFLAGHGEINEIRAVVQQVLGAETGEPVRLDDVEILYTDAATYVPLLYEFFSEALGREPAAALTKDRRSPAVTFSEGIACIYSRPGRALRAWLRWVKADYVQTKIVQMVREGILQRPAVAERIGYSRLASTLRRMSIGFQRDRYLPTLHAAISQARQSQLEYEQQRDDGEFDGELDGEFDGGVAREPTALAAGSTPGRTAQANSATNTATNSAANTATNTVNDGASAEAGKSAASAVGSHDTPSPHDFGLPTLQALLAIVEPLIRHAPQPGDSARTILTKTRSFLIKCARSEDKVDRFARSKLLDDVDGRLESLRFADESPAAVLSWLEELPLGTQILGSGPQPGCIHASPLHGGGFSGRKQAFVVGMDATRFPKSASVDPVLLDDERSRISSDLKSSVEIARASEAELVQALDRLGESADVDVHFSFATRNLVEGRELSPSPTLIEIFRRVCNMPAAGIDDLVAHVGPPVSFASTDPDRWLSEADRQLAELLLSPDEAHSRKLLESRFAHFVDRRTAAGQRDRMEFTEFDGFVPEAGSALSPVDSEQKVSPSRLETFGTCPRRFFFKYGLGVVPPDQWEVDPERWLNPIAVGNLVHKLFETFLRQLTGQNLVPNLRRDLPGLLDLLDAEIQSFQQSYPVPNVDAFQRQRDWLEEVCEIFLRKEQEYCEATGARPWVLEAAIGLDTEPQSPLDCREPVTLGLRDGRVLRVGGRIDRVDRLTQAGSESFAIWDYKSGSDFGFSQEDPFRQGRKLQSFVYVGMLRHRLAAMGHGTNTTASFGYFFPSSRTEGLRLQWTAGELKRGDNILRQICDLIQSGAFPATTEKSDCTYCDYLDVCKDPDFVSLESIRKAQQPRNRDVLEPWRVLRQFDETSDSPDDTAGFTQ